MLPPGCIREDRTAKRSEHISFSILQNQPSYSAVANAGSIPSSPLSSLLDLLTAAVAA